MAVAAHGAARGGAAARRDALLVLLLLAALAPSCHAGWWPFGRSRSKQPPPSAGINGTAAQLWAWWPAGNRSAPAGANPAFKCLADAFSGPPRDKRVYRSGRAGAGREVGGRAVAR
jgi:hypothetical protein